MADSLFLVFALQVDVMRAFAPKRSFVSMLAFGLFSAGQLLGAQNKYDVLARILQPYGALFYSKGLTKALRMDVIVREGPPLAAEILNQPLQITLEMPDKLRIETIDPQHRMVVCRNGQRVWAYPREFAATIGVEGVPPPKGAKIPDFRLPLKDQQIVWLPVLFQILRFEQSFDASGEPAWRIDFQLSPEISRRTKCDPWVASVVVKRHDFQVRSLHVETASWKGTIEILDSRFEPCFPAETWEAGPELANDATAIPAELFASALERLSAITIPR